MSDDFDMFNIEVIEEFIRIVFIWILHVMTVNDSELSVCQVIFRVPESAMEPIFSEFVVHGFSVLSETEFDVSFPGFGCMISELGDFSEQYIDHIKSYPLFLILSELG